MTTQITDSRPPISTTMQGGGELGAVQLGIWAAILSDRRFGKVIGESGSSAGGMNSYFSDWFLLCCEQNGLDRYELAPVFLRECWPALSIIPTNTQGTYEWLRDNLFGEDETSALRTAADFAFSPLTRLLNSGVIHQMENYANMAAFGPLLLAMPERLKFKLFKILLGDKMEAIVNFKELREWEDGPTVHVAGANRNTGSAMLFGREYSGGMATMLTASIPGIFPTIRFPVGNEKHTLSDGAMADNTPMRPHIGKNSDIFILSLMDVSPEDYPSFLQTAVHMFRTLKDESMVHTVHAAQHINRMVDHAHMAGHPNLHTEKICRFHRIGDEEVVKKYGLTVTMNFNAALSRQLFDDGLRIGQEWLAEHGHKVGKESTYVPPAPYPEDYEGPALADIPQQRPRPVAVPQRRRPAALAAVS